MYLKDTHEFNLLIVSLQLRTILNDANLHASTMKARQVLALLKIEYILAHNGIVNKHKTEYISAYSSVSMATPAQHLNHTAALRAEVQRRKRKVLFMTLMKLERVT